MFQVMPALCQGAGEGMYGLEVTAGVGQCLSSAAISALPGISPTPHRFSLPEFLACTEAATGLAGKRGRKGDFPAPHTPNAPIWPLSNLCPTEQAKC